MDVAGVIYEIDPSRAEQGAKRATSALEGLERRTDAFIAKMKALQRQLSSVLSFSDVRGSSATSATQALNKIESDFARHNQRIVELAAKSAARLQEIEAKKNATLASEREKAINRASEADRKILAQAQASEGRLQQIRSGNAGKVDVSSNRRLQAQIQADSKIQQAMLNSEAKLQAIASQNSGKLIQIEQKRLASLDVVRERFAQREIERQRREAEKLAKLQEGGIAGAFRRNASQIREAGESIQQTGYFLTGLSTALIGVGTAAVKSAFDVDKNINVLKALLGSSEAAETRFKDLVKLSQSTPGLTTGLAAQIDVQLRVANATEKAINKVLPAIGKLNAVSNIQDPQRFVQNLVQLVTQNFERIDLKELVGQSPLAGELIKQIFNVENAIDGEAIRAQAQKLGLTTVDAFFTAFGDAASKNAKLANITESLSTQFAKLVDRVTIALRPLGLAIVEALSPIVEKGAQIIEKLSAAFAALPSGLQSSIVVFGTLATVIAPAVVGIGAFIQAAGALGNLATVAKSLQVVTTGLQATAVASTAAGAAATTAGAATAAAFAPALPILLGIAAVIGVVAIAWANYETASEKAAKITLEQVRATVTARDEYAGLSGQLQTAAAEHGKLGAVMEKLPASSRAFADALQTEGERLAFVTEEITRQRDAREAVLASQTSTIIAGLSEQQKEIDLIRQRKEELEKEAIAVNAAAVAGQKLLVTESNQGRRYETTLQAQQRLGASLQETIEIEQKAIKVRDESAVKLDVLQKATGQTTKQLLDYQAQAGASKEEVERLARGLDEYAAQQRKAAGATGDTTSAMNDLGAAARQAGQDVANAFLKFDLQGIQKGVQAKTQEIAQRIVREGITAKKAFADAQREVVGTLPAEDGFPSVLTFGDANKRAQALKKAQDEVEKLVNPSPRSGGSRGSSRAESEARQLRDAQLRFEREALEQQARLVEDTNARELRSIQALYDDAKTTVKEFYDAKLGLAQANIGNEIDLIRRQVTETERLAAMGNLKAPEKIRLETELIKLRTELTLKTRALTDAETENQREFLKAAREKRELLLAETQKLALTPDELPTDVLPSSRSAIQEQAAAREKQLREQARRFSFADNELQREEIRIQNEVALGLRTEADGKRELLAVQRSYRDELIASLNAERELAVIAQDFERASQLETQIEQFRSLGAELSPLQSLFKGLSAETETFAEKMLRVGESIRATFVDAFQDLFERGPKAFFSTLLSSFKQLLARMVAEFLASKIFQIFLGKGGSGGSGSGGLGSILGGAASGGNSGGGFLGSLFGGGGQGSGGGGGGLLGSLFGGGGNSGFGQFATGGFSGGNPAQQILGGGQGGGLLGKIPGVGKLLGKIPGLGSLFGIGGGAAKGAAGAAAAGKAAAGVGSSAAGGGSLFASLSGLFTNPITAIVAGGIVGGIFLFKALTNRTEKALRKLIRSEYDVDVKAMDVLKQVKQLGDQAFKGSGGAKKNQLETIRLPESKQIIAQYAEATGQTNSKLLKELELQKTLQDPLAAQNRFAKRMFGGQVTAGRSYIVGDGGRPEVFTPGITGTITSSIRGFEQQMLDALRSSQMLGGIFGGIREKLINQLSARVAQSAPQAERFDGRRIERAIAANAMALGQLASEFAKFKTASPGDIVQKVADEKPEVFVDATDRGLAQGGQRVSSFQQRLAVA